MPQVCHESFIRKFELMGTMDGAWFYMHISEDKGYPHGLEEKVKMAVMMVPEVFFYMHCDTHTHKPDITLITMSHCNIDFFSTLIVKFTIKNKFLEDF